MNKNIFCLLSLLLSFSLFSSCEIDDGHINEDYLFGKYWSEVWYEGKTEIEQQFYFNYNGTGTEYYDEYFPGGERFSRYPFAWYWQGYDRIVLEYYNGDVSFLDISTLTYSRLTGWLDNDPVNFKAVY